jgi:hypothetical protein
LEKPQAFPAKAGPDVTLPGNNPLVRASGDKPAFNKGAQIRTLTPSASTMAGS